MNVGTQATKRGELAHLRTLADVVADFRVRYAHLINGAHYDPVAAYSAKAPNLSEAISRACAGRREDGKMFAMDSCIFKPARDEFTDRMTARTGLVARCKTFDDLHDVVEAAAVKGIGSLLIYNVTCRIGAHRGLEPRDHVYLHAGPLKGWKRLTGSRESPKRVSLSTLPDELTVLPPRLIEDLLCEYRDLLNPGFLS